MIIDTETGRDIFAIERELEEAQAETNAVIAMLFSGKVVESMVRV